MHNNALEFTSFR